MFRPHYNRKILFAFFLLFITTIRGEESFLFQKEENETVPAAVNQRQTTSSWGRLFVEGFPQRKGFQYFRAYYGISPPLTETTSLLLAEPIDLCHVAMHDTCSMHNGRSIQRILVTRRGNCSFAQKSANAITLGAQGVLIVNNEEGIMHPSATGIKDIQIFTSMIGKNHGENLISALMERNGSAPLLNGKFIPITCENNGGPSYCEPVAVADSKFVDSINYEGTIHLSNYNESFPYTVAEFGGYLDHNKSWKVMIGNKEEGETYCGHTSTTTTIPANTARKSMMSEEVAIVVPRGGCSFLDKAMHVSALPVGSSMIMLVVNDDDNTISMGGGNDHESSLVNIPSVMIPKQAGHAIQSLLEKGQDLMLTLEPNISLTN